MSTLKLKATAEDLARAEVSVWEQDVDTSSRSNIGIRRGLIDCIHRWRRESMIAGDYRTSVRCTEMLVSMGEES